MYTDDITIYLNLEDCDRTFIEIKITNELKDVKL